MILNRQAFTLSGPLTAAGDPTVWICNDPRLVEQAVKAHEQLWASGRVDLFARLAGVTRNPVSAATPPNPPSPR